MDNPIADWEIGLHDVPSDFDKLTSLFSTEIEIQIRREPSDGTIRYSLHSPKFKGLVAADQVRTVAAELIEEINSVLGGGSVTMGILVAICADGSRKTVVTSNFHIPRENTGTITANAVISIESLSTKALYAIAITHAYSYNEITGQPLLINTSSSVDSVGRHLNNIAVQPSFWDRFK